ncbi:DUF1294 domain-containing protein [Gilvimarinus chinensis]|uniref:DUF1294 domain-containing protein n=1 Tax=Gilvimarinus chinensis TaxID=396005 RepID=UPI00037969BC|nr:DUF1294 domain-containing protein [Gilvimarinus chinensis]
MARGKLIRWNDARGFGFLAYEENGVEGELFAHIRDFKGRGRPSEGDEFTFNIAPGKNGKSKAVNIRATGFNLSAPIIALLAAAAWLSLVYFLEHQQRADAGSSVYYLLASALSLAVFGWDKFQAPRNGRRVPEANLLLLTAAGGWPGGLVARHLFRHKTRKQPFRFIFWLLTILNATAFFFLFSEPGKTLLSGWIG